jgi:hypothetical protein
VPSAAVDCQLVDWPISGILGEETVGGRRFLWVRWEPTLVPSEDVHNASGLIKEYERHQSRRKRSVVWNFKVK